LIEISSLSLEHDVSELNGLCGGLLGLVHADTSITHRCQSVPDTPTARQGFPWRAFFLTVPFQATVKSLCGERPADAGPDQVRGRHDIALTYLGRT